MGLDSSTSVFIDFTVSPAQVVATYACNTIEPDTFGYEIRSQTDRYGDNLCAPERNNHGHATIAIAKQLDVNLYVSSGSESRTEAQHRKEYGWHTNSATRPKMLHELRTAVADGLLDLNDPDLIAEARSFTRNDLIDTEADPRLTTRHFDLLIACTIAWQLRNEAEVYEKKEDEADKEMRRMINQSKKTTNIRR